MKTIPKKVRIGKRTYSVTTVRAFHKQTHTGVVYPKDAKIVLARRGGFTDFKLPPAERECDFWHEVTHAILYDMKDPRWKDERFVIGFSKRLTAAIRSARKK